MTIDGSKYYYWRGKFIATGSLRAFDLMTRHYEAGNFADYAPPVGRRRKVEGTISGRAPLSEPSLEELARNLVDWYKNLPDPVIWNPIGQESPPMTWLSRQDHVHNRYGVCLKNRYGPRCDSRQYKGLETVTTEGDYL